MSQLAEQLIRRFGSARTGTITRRVQNSYDPISDTEVGGGTESQICEVVVLPVSDDDIGMRPDSPAQTESVKVLIAEAQLAWSPQPGDHIILPGRGGVFSITDLKVTAPDGDGNLWAIHAEKTADT